MAEPRVSVVVATHNRPRLLERAVASLLTQSFSDFELLIVDDASGPETAKLISKLEAADPRIRGLRCDQNLGPAGARNRAVAEARADLCAILDDDDLCLPHRLEQQVAVFDTEPEVDLVCSPVQWVDGFGERLAIWPGVLSRGELPGDPQDVFRLLYLENNKIPNTTLMVKTEWLRRFPYPEDLRVGEDWFAFMQMAATGARFRCIAEPLVLQLRATDHPSLMAEKVHAFRDQRKVLGKMEAWLKAQGLKEHKALRRRAESNQRIREARFFGGKDGLRLTGRALAYQPSNPAAWASLQHLLIRGGKKVVRTLRG